MRVGRSRLGVTKALRYKANGTMVFSESLKGSEGVQKTVYVLHFWNDLFCQRPGGENSNRIETNNPQMKAKPLFDIYSLI